MPVTGTLRPGPGLPSGGPAGDAMAGAGGAAGPAHDVRHQPPGDAKEERGQTNVYSPGPRKKQYRRVDASSAVVMPVESMHAITGSNPAVMQKNSNSLKSCIYTHIRA